MTKLNPRTRKKLIPSTITVALEETGLPYDITVGSKHFKITVNGKLAAIWPRNGGSDTASRATLNVRSQIRRAALGI